MPKLKHPPKFIASIGKDYKAEARSMPDDILASVLVWAENEKKWEAKTFGKPFESTLMAEREAMTELSRRRVSVNTCPTMAHYQP